MISFLYTTAAHISEQKLFQSFFLHTLFKVSQLKTIWFEAENWPEHFTLEAGNPFASAQAFLLHFFKFFPFYVLSFALCFK